MTQNPAPQPNRLTVADLVRQLAAEGAHGIHIHPNGRGRLVHRWGTFPFSNIEELERMIQDNKNQTKEP